MWCLPGCCYADVLGGFCLQIQVKTLKSLDVARIAPSVGFRLHVYHLPSEKSDLDKHKQAVRSEVSFMPVAQTEK